MRTHHCSRHGTDIAQGCVAAATAAPRSYLLLLALLLASCAAPDTQHQIVVSTREQKLALIDRGNILAIYPVSTSKFGLGDWRGSRFTPLGKLQIAEKIGDSAPTGTVFKDRRRTGEIVARHARGTAHRDGRQLWMHPDALERHHTTVRHSRNRRCGYDRERAARRCSSGPRLSSFNGRH